MWIGGMPPLGYDVKDRKLVVNDVKLVRLATSIGAISRSSRFVHWRTSLQRLA